MDLTPAEARAVAKDAYIYGFPLADHYGMQHSYVIDSTHAEYKGPWNQVHHSRHVYTPAAAVEFPAPLSAEDERSSLRFFTLVNFLLRCARPTRPSTT